MILPIVPKLVPNMWWERFRDTGTNVLMTLAIVFFVCVLIYSVLHTSWRRNGLMLPPGPDRTWISGNLHQLPKERLWLQVTEWGKKYGPVVYIRILNKETIFLNSAKAVLDLMESRASIYSDRPRAWMAGELAERKHSIFRTSSTDPRFRILRRLLQDGLNPRAAKNYRHIQVKEAHVLLNALAKFPDEFLAHIRRNAAAIMIMVAYGLQIGGNDDPVVFNLQASLKLGFALSTPGKYLVEFMPFLRYIPSWFPGASFKRKAQAAGKEMARLEAVPFERAKEQISTGDYLPSFASKHLIEDDCQLADSQKQHHLKWACGALYVGGGDTTVSALSTFFLVMALYPEVQRRAQADIDQVVHGRLPTLDDFDSLPYIQAIIKEVSRWGPVAPLALPHRVVQDDVYEGYFIPKGATVIGNIWAIVHDEDMYPNPFHFDPTRFLGEKPQPDPFKFIFGFGRRTCPGAHLAETTLFLNITNVLAVFNISKPLNEEGIEVEPLVEWSNGVATHLKPFKCQIRPRSENHFALLERLDDSNN